MPGRPAPGPILEVIDDHARLAPHDRERLTRSATSAARHLGILGEIRIKVIGDEAMAVAHQRYAGVAGTTDVLTFDLSERAPGGAAPVLDTDILVCADEARRQATVRGHSLEQELLLYVVHGLLHCLGHDDHDDAAAAAMHAREDEVLTAIGVGPVYRSGGGP